MAKPTTNVPDDALNVEPERAQEGEEALRSVLEAYGGDYADAAEYTEELENIIETAILVIASADDQDVDNVTQSLVTLVEAADGLSTEGTVALAEGVGENSEDLTEALESVLELQRTGQLDDLVDIAGLLSTLEINETTVDGMNRLLRVLDEAERETEPVGVFGILRSLSENNVRAGLGYLLTIVRVQGRRLRSGDR
jgi:uncharacterized protein YjgD (DUF1641 family)